MTQSVLRSDVWNGIIVCVFKKKPPQYLYCEGLSDPREMNQKLLKSRWHIRTQQKYEGQAHHEYCFYHMLPAIHRATKTAITIVSYAITV